MIYINNATEWVEIPKTNVQSVYKYGLKFINQTTHSEIGLITEDNSQVDTLYKFYIGNVIDKFEVGQYDYMIMSPNWKETYTSGVLQYGQYNPQVIGYSPTNNIIQYNPYISPTPKPKREIDIVENGTYDVVNYDIANVNVSGGEGKPEEIGNAEYTENGEYTINPNEGYVFSSVNVKVNTPEPKDEQTKSVNIDKNGDSVVTPDSGKVLTSVSISVNVPSDKKTEETFNKIYTDNGTYNINPTSGNVFSGGVVNVNVPKQKDEQEKSVNIVENGTTSIMPDSGKVLSKVDVNVNVPVVTPTQSKEVTITENKTETITPDSGFDLSSVTVNVNVPDPTLEELSVTENGVYTPTEYGYSKVTVNVPKDEFKLPNGTNFKNSTFSSITLGDTTSEITNFKSFFGGDPIASNLETVGEMNTSKGTDFTEMFAWNVNKLTSISGTLDLSNATTTNRMFYACQKLTNYPTIIVSDKLTNTAGMFQQNSLLTTMPIPLSALTNVTTTELMYGLCYALSDNILSVSLPNSINTNNMFGFSKITGLTNVNLPKATISTWMFKECTELTMMPSLNLPLVENAESMFEGCTKLGSVQLAGQSYDLSSLRKADNMFKNCNMQNVSNFPNVSLTSAVSMFEGVKGNISDITFLGTYDTGTDIDFTKLYKDSNITTSNIYINTPMVGQTLNLTSAFENSKIINDNFNLFETSVNEYNYIRINANRAYYNCDNLKSLKMGVFYCSGGKDNITDFYSGIIDANSMLYNCSLLSSIDTIYGSDTNKCLMYMGYCEDVTDMFYNCTSLGLSQICKLKDVGKGFTSYNKDFDLSYMTGYLSTSELKYFIDAFYDLNLNLQTSATVYFNNAVREQIEQYTVEEYDNKTISTILQERGWQIQYQSH